MAGDLGEPTKSERTRGARRVEQLRLEAAFLRCSRDLYRYTRLVLQDHEDARDTVQSTFVRALAAVRAGERRHALRPWLFRLANEEAALILRRRRLEQELPNPQRSGDRAQDEEIARGRWSQLLADLRELPERQRTALALRELVGLSFAEVAAALAISERAAIRAVHMARLSLYDAAEGRALPCKQARELFAEANMPSWRRRRLAAHLGDCPGCSEFARQLGERREQLHALAPVPAYMLVAGGLWRLLRIGYAKGGGTGAAASATGLGSGPTAALLAGKVALGVAVVATATSGVHVAASEGATSGLLPSSAHAARAHRVPSRAHTHRVRAVDPWRARFSLAPGDSHRRAALDIVPAPASATNTSASSPAADRADRPLEANGRNEGEAQTPPRDPEQSPQGPADPSAEAPPQREPQQPETPRRVRTRPPGGEAKGGERNGGERNGGEQNNGKSEREERGGGSGRSGEGPRSGEGSAPEGVTGGTGSNDHEKKAESPPAGEAGSRPVPGEPAQPQPPAPLQPAEQQVEQAAAVKA